MSLPQDHMRQSMHSLTSVMAVHPHIPGSMSRAYGNRGSSYLVYGNSGSIDHTHLHRDLPIRSSSYAGFRNVDLRQTEPLPSYHGIYNQSNNTRVMQIINDRDRLASVDVRTRDIYGQRDHSVAMDGNQDLIQRLKYVKEENLAIKRLNKLLIQKLRALNELSSIDQ
jgi:hypothetical protein